MNDHRPLPALEAGAPAPAIRLRSDASAKARRSTRWRLMLVIFMRLVGVLWLLQGLLHWCDVIAPDRSAIETLPALEAAALMAFGVLDLVAAVGLWLVAPWGGVMWVLAAAAQMGMIALRRRFFPSAEALFVIDGALIVTYLLLTYSAGREEMETQDS